MENNNRRYIEFSKILTATIVLLYILNWIATWVCYVFTGSISIELKEYLDVPLNVIMTGYFVKSGTEKILVKK